MDILEKLRIAKGVEIIPIQEVNDLSTIKGIEYNDDDYILNKPKSRVRSKIISHDLAIFLKYFDEPATIVDAVIKYAAAIAQDPNTLLPQVHPFLLDLIHKGFLVFNWEDRSGDMLKPGDEFEGYKVIRNIYKVIDTELYEAISIQDHQLQVVIKIAVGIEVNKALTASFENETKILDGLPGTYTPRLISQGIYNGHPYMVILKIKNTPLLRYVSGLRIENKYAAILDLIKNVLIAYDDLHTAGICHVDINPRNILVIPEGKIYIIDFGSSAFINNVSRWIPEIESFSPPEAIAILSGHSKEKWDFYSEQYSIAALLYYLCTGKHYLKFSFEKDTMRKQLLEDKPLTFAQQDIPSFLQLENILFKALSKDRNDRYPSIHEMLTAVEGIADHKFAITDQFIYPLLDLGLYDHTDHLIEKLGSEKVINTYFNRAPAASIFNGGAGIAYFLYRHALNTQSAELLALADIWCNRSKAASHDENAFINEAIGFSKTSVEKVSLYNHMSGLYLVQALICIAQANKNKLLECISAIIKIAKEDTNNNDMTMGRSGTLLALSIVIEAIPDYFGIDIKPIVNYGNQYLQRLWSTVQFEDNICDDYKVKYTGIAHGWAGLIYAALRWCDTTGTPVPAFMEKKIEELYALHEDHNGIIVWRSRINSRSYIYMPGWCNGGSGFMELFILAGKMFNNSRYIQIADRVSVDVYKNKTNYADLCCGLAGRAYAMISMYNATQNEKYYDKAKLLLKRAGGFKTFLKTDSLFKGKFGLKLLELEIDNPQGMTFPVM